MSQGMKAAVAGGITAAILAAFAVGLRVGRPSIPALTEAEKQGIKGAYAPPTSPSNNAAPIYCRVFERMRLDGYLEGEARETLIHVISGGIPAKASGLPRPFPAQEERLYVGEGWCEYDELERVQAMDCDFNLDYSMGPMLVLPHLSQMRGLARVLALQAWFDYEDGNSGLALKRIGCMFTMARHMSGEPLAISQMVAAAIDNMAVDALADMAFRLRDDTLFLQRAVGLLRGTPARLIEPASIIRRDVQITVSHLLRRADDPNVKSSDIVDELTFFTGGSVGPTMDDQFLWIDLEAVERRRSIEKQLHLPEGWLSEKNFRPLLAKAAAVCLREVERYASALSDGPAAAAQWLREFDARLGEPGDKPEAFLAAMLVGGLTQLPRVAARAETRREAAISVVEALAKGTRQIAPRPDSFGGTYSVTWFEDAVYFQSPSQWAAPHDLDLALPRHMSYEDFQQRLEADKVGTRQPGARE